VDVGALHDASALLRARPGGLAAYFPEGVDELTLIDGYATGYSPAHDVMRGTLTDELTQLADSFAASAKLLRSQPGLGALADSVDGAAALATEGADRTAHNQIHEFGSSLQDALNDVSRIAITIDGIASRGRMPADRAAVRARMQELTAPPFGRQSIDELHELAMLADDLPPDVALVRAPRPSWEKPLREYLRTSDDEEMSAALRAVQVGRVAELHSRARYPDLDAALGRVDHLIASGRTASLDETIELYGLLERRDRRTGVRIPTDVSDRIADAIGFLDEKPPAMERARVDLHVARLATFRSATKPGAALDVAHTALSTARADLDATSAGRIDGLLDLTDELSPVQDPLFTPHRELRMLLRSASGTQPWFLKANTDVAWAEATIDSALTGMRADVELARSGRRSIDASAAPARLAEVTRGAMGPTEVLEAQFLATRLGAGVLDAAGATATGRVALGVRLATAELLQFGNEADRLPIVRGYLESARGGLDDVRHAAVRSPQETSAVDQLQALLDRNIARIDGTGPTDGYLRHPDAAEVGRASQLAQLLDRIDASRGTVPEGTDLLTW
jgi:hypothetical protein